MACNLTALQVEELTSVAVLDPDIVSREGLSSLISNIPGFKGVGYDLHLHDQFVSSSADHQIVVINVQELDRRNIGVIKKLKSQSPAIGLIVYFPSGTPADHRKLIQLNVDGLITERLKADLLRLALSSVQLGAFFSTNKTCLEITGEEKAPPEELRIIKQAFTAHQIRILSLMAAGNKAKDIANLLDRSVSSINWHKNEMMRLT